MLIPHNWDVTALPPDYDTDPERFLSNAKWDHDDVHPHVAERIAQAGAKRVLDVGGRHGALTRLLPDLGMKGVLLDISPTMLALGPRPAVRADEADHSQSPTPASMPSRRSTPSTTTRTRFVPISECRRVLRTGGLFAACSANRNSAPELPAVLPVWGESGTFDGEDSLGHRRRCLQRPA